MIRSIYAVLSIVNGANAILSGRGLRWLRNITVLGSVARFLRKN